MLLFPSKTKYKKSHKRFSVLKKREFNYNHPSLGYSGLKSLSAVKLSANQIEAVRKIIVKSIKKKKKLKLKFCLYPDLPITKKSAGIRMGKGKGNVEYWSFLVKKGRVIFELEKKQIEIQKIFNCFLLASLKLPGKWLVVI